ncbi:MAG TPA: hypothetical protein VFF06_12610 [Polyangia bacterium]|nr:hypothetical protein [Polyangia bacterium]
MRSIAMMALAAALASCGSSSLTPPPCDVEYDCPAGQTCWALDGKNWSCMPSGAGRAGDTCESITNTLPSCGDGLACLATGDPHAGTCVAWCDSAHPCPPSSPCQAVNTTQGATLHFCR